MEKEGDKTPENGEDILAKIAAETEIPDSKDVKSSADIREEIKEEVNQSRRKFMLWGVLGALAVTGAGATYNKLTEKGEGGKSIWDRLKEIFGPNLTELQKNLLEKKGYKFDENSNNVINFDKLKRKNINVLNEKVVVVKTKEGDTVLDTSGDPVLAKETAAKKIAKVHQVMIDDGEGGLKINSHYRPNDRQNELYIKLKKKSPKAKVTEAGNSMHEIGQAIDLDNWEDAEPYLTKEGFRGGYGGIGGDYIHFSYGGEISEKDATTKVVRKVKHKAKQAADKAKEIAEDAKNVAEDVYEGGKDLFEQAKEWNPFK